MNSMRPQVLSSILYLSGDPTIGPTIFLEGVGAGRGWRVAPQANRYVAFPGTMLHGVLPAARTAPLSCCQEYELVPCRLRSTALSQQVLGQSSIK